jgi:hypothetical protein
MGMGRVLPKDRSDVSYTTRLQANADQRSRNTRYYDSGRWNSW